MIEAAICALLNPLPAFTGIPIRPGKLDQNSTYPAIAFWRVSGARVESFGGASGLASPVFQFDVYADTYTDAATYANALQTALEGFRGTVAGVNINGIIYLGDMDGMSTTAPTGYDSDAEKFVRSSEFQIWHNE